MIKIKFHHVVKISIIYYKYVLAQQITSSLKKHLIETSSVVESFLLF